MDCKDCDMWYNEDYCLICKACLEKEKEMAEKQYREYKNELLRAE